MCGRKYENENNCLDIVGIEIENKAEEMYQIEKVKYKLIVKSLCKMDKKVNKEKMFAR